MKRYVQDGRLAIDNNLIERLLRAVAIGRNNWLFVGSPTGAETAAWEPLLPDRWLAGRPEHKLSDREAEFQAAAARRRRSRAARRTAIAA